jgi:hypothetical protein
MLMIEQISSNIENQQQVIQKGQDLRLRKKDNYASKSINILSEQ